MSTAPASLVGTTLRLEVGPVAHGGHFVARHEGRVVFVRHALPGEQVDAVVTEGHEESRYLRADAVHVVEPSPDRVEPPCPLAGPGRCGGCDFQHVSLARQRALKADVVREQLRRLAQLDLPVEVVAVPGDSEGLRWRTRVRWSAAADRSKGLKRHRSDEVIPVGECLIADPRLPDPGEALAHHEHATSVVASQGQTAVVAEPPGPELEEHAAGRTWRVVAGDFWQVHPGAAQTLVDAVLAVLRPLDGERCWDLYAGVGLLSGPLAERVGPAGRVLSVESHRRASRLADRNLGSLAQVRVVTERVDRFVRSRIAQGRLDLVVLDPPRAGAGADVVRGVARQRPRAVAYVACDPAALARDLATFRRVGYEVDSLRAFDLFPMTHHVECVAGLRPR